LKRGYYDRRQPPSTADLTARAMAEARSYRGNTKAGLFSFPFALQ